MPLNLYDPDQPPMPVVRMEASDQGALPKALWGKQAGRLSGAMVDNLWDEPDPTRPKVHDPRKLVDERTAPGS